MKVIFIGTTGVHHALVAAHLLAGEMTGKRYSALKGFDDCRLEKNGQPLLVHDDGRGNQIFALGVGKDLQLAHRAITQFIDVCGFKSSDLWIEPVTIKGDKLFLWLVRTPDIKSLKTASHMIMERLIRWQFMNIRQTVHKVAARMRTVPSCYE